MCSNSFAKFSIIQAQLNSSSTSSAFILGLQDNSGGSSPPFVLAPASADSDFMNYSDQPTAKLLKAGTSAMSIKFDYKPDNHQLESNQRKFPCNLCT
jgi:hypothetical protein